MYIEDSSIPRDIETSVRQSGRHGKSHAVSATKMLQYNALTHDGGRWQVNVANIILLPVFSFAATVKKEYQDSGWE